MVFVFGLPLLLSALELDNKNLKGLNYARIQCEFNGVPYFKGYKSAKAEKVEEFNLVELEKKLADAGIPLAKELPRSLYNRMESKLKTAGLRVVGIRGSDDRDDSTILATVSIAAEIIPVSEDSFAALVYVTVSQWMSTWVGSENINTPVITWWQKKILTAAPADLNQAVDKACTGLIDDFVVQLTEANKDKEEEPLPGKQESKPKK